MEPDKILVLRGGALGDFLVTLPALASLRERWPRARLELIGNAAAAQLARTRGLLDAVHSQHEARWTPLFRDSPLPAALAAWLGEFDLVVNYWPDPDGELRRRFPMRDGQMFLHAPAMPTCAPAAKHYCEPLRALGLEATQHFFRLEVGRVILNPPPQEPCRPGERRVKDSAPYPIAIHPGSGSSRKNWPMENWRALIAQLPPPLSLILGEAEADLVGPALAAGPRPADPPSPRLRRTGKRQPCDSAFDRVTVLRNRPLEELVAHFAECRLFLGHDSGISHLAAACGVPCVLLFGPTNPEVWAPPAPNVRVLRRCPDLNSISVEEVRRAAEAALHNV